ERHARRAERPEAARERRRRRRERPAERPDPEDAAAAIAIREPAPRQVREREPPEEERLEEPHHGLVPAKLLHHEGSRDGEIPAVDVAEREAREGEEGEREAGGPHRGRDYHPVRRRGKRLARSRRGRVGGRDPTCPLVSSSRRARRARSRPGRWRVATPAV